MGPSCWTPSRPCSTGDGPGSDISLQAGTRWEARVNQSPCGSTNMAHVAASDTLGELGTWKELRNHPSCRGSHDNNVPAAGPPAQTWGIGGGPELPGSYSTAQVWKADCWCAHTGLIMSKVLNKEAAWVLEGAECCARQSWSQSGPGRISPLRP